MKISTDNFNKFHDLREKLSDDNIASFFDDYEKLESVKSLELDESEELELTELLLELSLELDESLLDELKVALLLEQLEVIPKHSTSTLV